MSVRLFEQQWPQKTCPQCLYEGLVSLKHARTILTELTHLQWCFRTTTEKSVLQLLHQKTALSLTQRGPFSLCFGCWNFFSGLPQGKHANNVSPVGRLWGARAAVRQKRLACTLI